MAAPTEISMYTSHDLFEKNYKAGRTLGQGSFATVKLCISLRDQKKWAVKIIKRNSLEPGDAEALKSEITILHSMHHENIVALKEVYETPTNVYLVQDLMLGGELFDRIVQKEHYSEAEAKAAIVQVIRAIEYCHSRDVVHRDLKPENLLYATTSDDAALKLADFGLATILKSEELLHSACGTPGYVAPEILSSRGNHMKGYGKEVDLWSIGVILYILLCGFPPFYDEDNQKLFSSIMKAKYEFTSPYWDGISATAKDLVSKLLEVDPKKRLDCKQALAHPFINEPVSNTHLPHFVENLKAYNARRRLRGAIRAIMMANLMHKMVKNGETDASAHDIVLSSFADVPGGGAGTESAAVTEEAGTSAAAAAAAAAPPAAATEEPK